MLTFATGGIGSRYSWAAPAGERARSRPAPAAERQITEDK